MQPNFMLFQSQLFQIELVPGRVLMGSVSGPAKYLTTQQEKKLVILYF